MGSLSSSRVASLFLQGVKNIELKSVISMLTSAFKHKITHAEPIVQCIYATAVLGNVGAAFTFLPLRRTMDSELTNKRQN